MPCYIFPGEHVFWSQLKNHTDIKNKIIPKIENLIKCEKNKNPWKSCKVSFSTFNDNPIYDKCDHLNFLTDQTFVDEIVWNSIDEMYKQLKMDHKIEIPTPQDFALEHAFINIYNKDDFQEVHNHTGKSVIREGKIYNPIFSLIYIFHESDTEKTCNIFKTKRPEGYRSVLDTTAFNTKEIKTIKEGTVLIFPASLDHYIEPTIKSGRTTIVYNILANWY
jgi:hypothetical protein